MTTLTMAQMYSMLSPVLEDGRASIPAAEQLLRNVGMNSQEVAQLFLAFFSTKDLHIDLYDFLAFVYGCDESLSSLASVSRKDSLSPQGDSRKLQAKVARLRRENQLLQEEVASLKAELSQAASAVRLEVEVLKEALMKEASCVRMEVVALRRLINSQAR